MKILMIRHAKAEVSEGKNYSEASITRKGLEQCRRLAKYLSACNIDKVYCSSMLRAKETLDGLKPALIDVEMEITEMIKERDKGIYEAKSDKELIEALKKSSLKGRDFRPEGGENFHDVLERSKHFLEKLKNDQYENIAIISHSGFISACLMSLIGISYDDMKFININNCSISTFEVDREFNLLNFNINNCDHFLKHR